MKYNKNLINDLFEIKEKLNDDDKETVERFMEQYNEMYAEYRHFQEEKALYYKNLKDKRASKKKKSKEVINT